DAEVSRLGSGKFELKSNQFHLVKTQGRQWPVEEPEKFYRLSEASIARFQNAGFLTDFALATEAMLRSITYLGPLREHPQRMYQWSGDKPQLELDSGFTCQDFNTSNSKHLPAK